jgi:hypothetical protein
VGWPFFSNRMLRAALAVMILGLVVLASACGMHAVRPAEREHLADRIMLFDDDPHEIVSDDHVLSNREGSAGGRGTAGGGCGCN